MGKALSAAQIIYSKCLVYAFVADIGHFCFYFNFGLVPQGGDFRNRLAVVLVEVKEQALGKNGEATFLELCHRLLFGLFPDLS